MKKYRLHYPDCVTGITISGPIGAPVARWV